MENSIEEDMKILEGIIKGDEDCINAIYSQMKVKNDDDEDIQYYKKEIQSIKNIVDNYLKEKARADKLEKEYSAMLTKSDEDECDYKRVLKENEQLSTEVNSLKKENEELKNENRRLKVIRYSTEYGTENIHLITKSDLVEINTNKYFIEIQDGKFVDLKQVYQENEKLNEYKENYIPAQKIKDKIEEIQEEGYWLFTTDRDSDKCVEVLQELIEGRKHE